MMPRVLALVSLAACALACSAQEPRRESWRGRILSGERSQSELISPDVHEFGGYGEGLTQLDDALLVGEPNADLGVGRVWQYELADAWTLSGQLKPDPATSGQRFGSRIRVSDDQIIVSAPGDGFDVTGNVQVFARSSPKQAQLLSSDELDFGSDIALSGERLLVGAARSNLGHAGSATLFRRAGDAWSLEHQLQHAQPAAHEDFGVVVSLSASVAAVASRARDTDEPEVTLFELQGETWVESTTISGVECDALALDEEHLFIGEALSNDHPAGAVHVFSRADGWQEVAALETDAPTHGCGKALSLGVDALTVACDTAVIVFARRGSEGFEEVEDLFPPVSKLADIGLSTLSVASSALAVGALHASAANVDFAGAVFVFGSCRSDAECDAGRFCAASGRCQAVAELAAGCERDGQCASGHCVDGICCDAACSDSCEACAEPEHVGRCVAVEGEPRGERGSCAGHGMCGGSCTGLSRSCSYTPSRTPCGGSCSDGVEVKKSCDGGGSCQDDAEQSCGAYVCRDGACLTVCEADEDCRDGSSCLGGSCVELSVTKCTRAGDASVGPLGSRSCGAYRCDVASGACLSACSSSSQCAPGYLCDTTTRNCVNEAPRRPDAGGCSCRTVAPERRSGGWLTCLLAGTLLTLRRRRWQALVAGWSLLGSTGCHSAEPDQAEDLGSSSAQLAHDSIWVKGSRLSGGDSFGQVLAASGSGLLVGGNDSLDWLVRVDGGWQRAQRVQPSEVDGDACSALSLALDDDVALVSSLHGARLFLRDAAGQFIEQPRLGTGPNVSEVAGCFVQLHGSHAAVGDDLQTTLFERDANGFQDVTTLPGEVLALTDDSIVVAWRHDDTFVLDVNVYAPLSKNPKLVASLPQPIAPDSFQPLVVADAASLVVAGSGLIYAYDMSDLDAPPATLKPTDDAEHPSFGGALALAGDVLLVGDPVEQNAQVFRGSARKWRPTFSVQGVRDAAGRLGQFGSAVAIQDDELVVGAPQFALATLGPFGAAFVYGRCSDRAPCPAGYYCAADAFCAPTKALGELCAARAGQDCLSDGCAPCDSGNCVDGVCCESRCGGQCEACAEPGSPGKCVLIAGDPRPPREACAGSDATCHGTCSGQEPACVYPGSSDACGSSCEDGRETPATCNGHGDCIERSSRSCLGYACGDGSCLTRCQADADCVTGFDCEKHACLASVRAHTCSQDGTRSLTDEAEIPCGFYRCDEVSGDCRQDCTLASDCAAGLVCDVPNKVCVRESSASPADTGCGCLIAGRGAEGRAWLLPGAAMLCWLARRWRQRDWA